MLMLAWRNLWRQGRRSLISLLAVAIVVLFAILMYGMGGALSNGMYTDLTTAVGNIQIHTSNYRDAEDYNDTLLNNAAEVKSEVETVLKENESDVVLVGALQAPALLAGEDRSRGLVIQAQDWPVDIRNDFKKDHLVEGSFIEEANFTGIMLGQSLATSLEVSLGDDVYVYAPGTEGYGAAAYTVEALLDFDDPNQEIRSAYVSLQALQELAAPDALSRLELHYPSINTMAQDGLTKNDLAALQTTLGSQVEVEAWREIDPNLATILNFLNPILTFGSLIFFILAGLLVLNTVYLSTLERIREFGVILSLGAPASRVMGMVTLESILMCLSGAILGLVLGLGLIALGSNGVTFPAATQEMMAQVGMPSVLYPTVKVWQVLLAVGFAILTAFLAAFGPARLASRIAPAEAMRHTV